MLQIIRNKKGIWKRKLLSRDGEGLFVLAPMADVTDNAFREIVARHAAPDVLYTEFVSADGLAHPQGKKRLLRDLDFTKKQQKSAPIIAQIFSGNPDNIRQAAKLVQSLGFDGIDINTGCPSRNITKQLCGSELIKRENRELAGQLIQAVKEGAPKLDVAVKTRLGWSDIDMSWIEFLLQQNIDVLTVHLRTRKEMSKVSAHWELMTEIREMRDKIAPDTILLGNGDINTLSEARSKVQEHGIDGVMIGRGIFKNPLIFDADREPTIRERYMLLKEHITLFEANFGPTKRNMKEFGKSIKSFYLMKKFLKVYINNFPGAKDIRTELMQINNPQDLLEEVDRKLKKLN